ncbi:peptide deformylase [Vibrio hepatarius]|uniref:peptide deformylase n=1 Tax=Vibrio hepatarius TaxID=171383 RepID=UPI001C09F826|nr:peptide deformylase [Vibrio hepatarius]MBU2898707.1 peptide deformylase [Vibrio hepatarius]
MKKAQILAFGEPSLHIPSAEVDFNDPDLSDEIEQLIVALKEFQYELGWGRAMAAPQIGINKRMIAIRINQKSQVLINPQITRTSSEKMVVWDDCMSMPNIAVEVERHCSIDIRYTDESGQQCSLTNTDRDFSELLQHEIDHLDGIVMTDRIISGGAVIQRDLVEKYEGQRGASKTT